MKSRHHLATSQSVMLTSRRHFCPVHFVFDFPLCASRVRALSCASSVVVRDEGFAALTADKWFFSGVNSGVIRQVTSVREAFSTHRAHVFELRTVRVGVSILVRC